MLNIKTTPDGQAQVEIEGTQTEILTQLACAVGAILVQPQFTEASIKTFDSFYKKAIKHYRKEKGNHNVT